MYKISIIIPIYNVERYIKECLKSILEQITPEIEVILINDGTPDKSVDITKTLLRDYSTDIQNQFVLVNQENQGLSGARNKGLELARGQYIAFIDSDDRVSETYINEILNCINKNEPDIIDFNLITSQGDIIYTRRGDFSSLDSVFLAGAWYSCARVVKKEIINNSRFIPKIYYEDLAFSPALYINSKKVNYLNHSLYWYRLNDEGITMTLTEHGNLKTIESLEVIVMHYLEIYLTTNNPYYGIVFIQSYFLLCVNACRRISLKASIFYMNKYKKEINKLNITVESIDKKALDSKMRWFYSFPSAYLLSYNMYCFLKRNK